MNTKVILSVLAMASIASVSQAAMTLTIDDSIENSVPTVNWTGISSTVLGDHVIGKFVNEGYAFAGTSIPSDLVPSSGRLAVLMTDNGTTPSDVFYMQWTTALHSTAFWGYFASEGCTGITGQVGQHQFQVGDFATTYALVQKSGNYVPFSEGQGSYTTDAPFVITLTSVPEPSTIIAGALLLLPLGMSSIRAMRKTRV